MQESQSIILKGVRTNNLKSVDVEIPLGAYTVVTGKSGSGKSSLAFETLFADVSRGKNLGGVWIWRTSRLKNIKMLH